MLRARGQLGLELASGAVEPCLVRAGARSCERASQALGDNGPVAAGSCEIDGSPPPEEEARLNRSDIDPCAVGEVELERAPSGC